MQIEDCHLVVFIHLALMTSQMTAFSHILLWIRFLFQFGLKYPLPLPSCHEERNFLSLMFLTMMSLLGQVTGLRDHELKPLTPWAKASQSSQWQKAGLYISIGDSIRLSLHIISVGCNIIACVTTRANKRSEHLSIKPTSVCPCLFHNDAIEILFFFFFGHNSLCWANYSSCKFGY